MEFIKKIPIRTYADARGRLSVVEGEDTVPFQIKRAFFTYAPTPGACRGGHANKTASFAMINIAGTCRLRISDGVRTETICFNGAMEGVLLPAMTWKELYDYSPDSVILFLSDRHYNKNDYIYDHAEFLALTADLPDPVPLPD